MSSFLATFARVLNSSRSNLLWLVMTGTLIHRADYLDKQPRAIAFGCKEDLIAGSIFPKNGGHPRPNVPLSH